MGEFQSDDFVSDVAIVGMSGRFPKAKNIDEFWENLCQGKHCISFFSDEELHASGVDASLISNPDYVKAKAILDDVELFDADFFRLNPREAEIIDPQQRLLLECAWKALENAGYNADNYDGLISVYCGSSNSTYFLNNLLPNGELIEKFGIFQTGLGNINDQLATRISYKLNLKGPSLTIQTACSTSLVAVVTACQSLLGYQCDMALAGGVSIFVPQKSGYLYQEGMIASPDGYCRAFDAGANGTVGGNGLGIVVLKRLIDAIEDGDCIRAVIKGAALNNDGSSKVGYTAPSIEGQSNVIYMAQALAGVEAETISYIEAHGTGTQMGDPIEIAALTKAFRESTGKKGFCAIGSVKSNIGHLDVAAGVAGLIKTVLALEHKKLPPSLHFRTPNPKLGIEDSPFYVNTALVDWPKAGTPRRAGVSSFGIGGTNAHLILEEYSDEKAFDPATFSSSSRPYQLLTLSAKTAESLSNATEKMIDHFKKNPEINLTDASYTLQVGRKAFKNRRMVVCRDLKEGIQSLETPDPSNVYTAKSYSQDCPIVFMFPGQGSQYVNMASELYRCETIFRDLVEHCSNYLRPLINVSLTDVIYPADGDNQKATETLEQTAVTQPALFAIEYALAKLWERWGIKPSAMIGHSVGEFVAACLANVMTLEEALTLIALRGRLMQNQPGGAMVAIHLSEVDIQPFIGDDLSLAAINSPSLCTLSGPHEAVKNLETMIIEKGVGHQRVHTSHAFHSKMLLPVLEPFKEQAKKIKLKTPEIPYISNVTGTWITEKEATDPDYWARHIVQTVRFADGIQEVLKDPESILLEVGPGQTLCILTELQSKRNNHSAPLTTLHHPRHSEPDFAFMLNTLGQLWLRGAKVDWLGFYSNEERRRIPLPTYPFERRRYWIEPNDRQLNRKQPQPVQVADLPNEMETNPIQAMTDQRKIESPEDVEKAISFIWQDMLSIEKVNADDDFYELGGHSLLAIQILSRIKETFNISLPLESFFAATKIKALAELVNALLWTEQSGKVDNRQPFEEREAFTI